MYSFKDSRTLNYTARQLYDLVLDVEQYNKFVPWCSKCVIISRSEHEIIADLSVKSGFITKTYRSQIKHGVENENYFIEINQLTGPFKHLYTKWLFEKKEKNSTYISFKIEFAFESELLNKLIGGIFEHASRSMIEAFEKRAKVIYGKGYSYKTAE